MRKETTPFLAAVWLCGWLSVLMPGPLAHAAAPALGQPGAAGKTPDGPFCQMLGRINAGADDPGNVMPYEHAAKIFAKLKPLAPERLQSVLNDMERIFAGVSAKPEQGQSILPAFAQLSSPALIDLEHRLAEGIAEECGIVLGERANWPRDTVHSAVPAGADMPACKAWTRQSNAIFNNRFPFTIDTSGANYFGFSYKVEPGGWIELKGDYPKSRYFSFLPNDMHTDNLHQLTDVHIDPDPGSVNPWRAVPPSNAAQHFTIRFAFAPPPKKPPPNTSYVGLTKHGEPNQGGIVVFRIYGSDLGNAPNSAGVSLPAMTVHGADGQIIAHYEPCDPYPKPVSVKFSDVPNFPPLPIPGSFTEEHPKLSNSANYNLPVDVLANPDVQYATLYFSHRFGDLFIVHAKAFTTPDTRKGEARSKRTDAEGWTVCNYNLLSGIAQTCRMDHDLKIDKDGYFTGYVSAAAARPRETGATQDANWFEWGPYLDNQITWRFFRADQPKIKALTAAISGGAIAKDIAPYIPRGVYCKADVFEAGGWAACAHAAGIEP